MAFPLVNMCVSGAMMTSLKVVAWNLGGMVPGSVPHQAAKGLVHFSWVGRRSFVVPPTSGAQARYALG
jgi:hypothetical protein